MQSWSDSTCYEFDRACTVSANRNHSHATTGSHLLMWMPFWSGFPYVLRNVIRAILPARACWHGWELQGVPLINDRWMISCVTRLERMDGTVRICPGIVVCHPCMMAQAQGPRTWRQVLRAAQAKWQTVQEDRFWCRQSFCCRSSTYGRCSSSLFHVRQQ